MLKIIKRCYKIPQNLIITRNLSKINAIKTYHVNSKSLPQKSQINLRTYSTVNIEEPQTETDENKSETPVEYPDLSDIINGDDQLEYKYKLLQLEIEVMRQNGNLVPSIGFLKHDHWVELLSKNSRSGRGKYLMYLFKLEMKKLNLKEKKVQRRIEKEEFLKNKVETKEGEIRYGLSDNSILIRIRDGTINQLYNNKLIQAMQFNEKLVIDCGYGENMSTRENINCAKQLMMLFAENRYNNEPYDIHFCNFNKQNVLAHYLHKNIPTMYDSWYPMNFHEESYLNLFPKERLLYLTPHCQQELVYNPDDIYIIGGIVDKMHNEPVSLAKAKKEGLRMAKFPLDRYLDWGAGSGKSLTLNQVLLILLDLKQTKNWKYALRHVPRRKLVNDRDETGDNIKRFHSLRYDKPDENDDFENIRKRNWNEYMRNKNNNNNYSNKFEKRNGNYDDNKRNNIERRNKMFRMNKNIFED